jgi:polysaccharide biosynthesis protein PslH
MKILWITFGVPYPPDSGVRQRDFHLIREAAREARVILFCLAPTGGVMEPGRLREFCERVEVWPMAPALPPLRLLARLPASAWRNFDLRAQTRIAAIIETESPDLVQIEHSLLAAYRLGVPEAACRTVLSLHNIASDQYRGFACLSYAPARRVGYLAKAWLMRRAEARLLPQFDSCLAVSELDRARARRLAPRVRCEVVENGVNCSAPLPATEGLSMLFTGVMNYPPNADGARWFCRAILPRIRAEAPGAAVVIVGHNPPAAVRSLARLEGVTVSGYVPDLTSCYREAAIAVAPLRAGGGTRLKILEAMALGRAVVATGTGCEGLAVEHRRHLLIADEPEAFADCAIRLLKDNALRERLAAAGRRLVEERYDWPIIGARLRNLYRSLWQQPVSP